MPRGKSDHHHQHHHGFGSRVQSALGRLAPRSWGGSAAQHPPPTAAERTSTELSSARSTASTDADSTAPYDGIATRPAAASVAATAGSISHISSTNSLASGSSAQQVPRPASAYSSAAAQHGDDLCSVATQAGSAAHSFSSLQSMMLTSTHGGDAAASSDGGPAFIGSAVPAAVQLAAGPGLSTSPTAAGSSNISLLSAYRGSDAGGDATSVSTLPLISEAGVDERLLDIQTLTEEQDAAEQARRLGGDGASSEGGPEPSTESLMTQPKGRISSSHGSYTSLTSATSDPVGASQGAAVAGTAAAAAAGAATTARIPSPAHSRMAHGQRSGSRHSFQQQLQLQQQLQQQQLQDLEESQEEGSISTGLPVPFSTRRRPDNDDMCSYATQAGSSVHSLSSVMSHMSNTQPQQQQRPHWSSDGNTIMPSTGSSKSFSSLQQQAATTQQQQQQQSRSRRSSAEPRSPLRHGHATSGTSAAASPVTDLSLGGSRSISSRGGSPTCSQAGDEDEQQQHQHHMHHAEAAAPSGQQQQGLQRKNSLKGALRAVSRWGSGISQRLQRTGSSSGGVQHQHHHHQGQ